MAPSVAQLHKLVSKNARLAKALWKNVTQKVQRHLPADATLQPALIRNSPRQPVHPIAYLKQSRGRWYTTHNSIASAVRRFTSSAPASGPKYNRANFPRSRVGSAVNQLSGRAPFASTLRPNLTGGALGRSAGGYGFGGGSARYFSHGPAAPAQVIQNVSQAMRAFFISGHKAQFDGSTPRGEMRFKAVTVLQDEVGKKMKRAHKASPGSYIDFNVNPTITALAPSAGLTGFSAVSSTIKQQTLGSEGLIDVLSVDFSRSLRELGAILECLKRLSKLGDLPITYHDHCLRVHFPGCDADSVARLCDELGIFRGVIHQDEDFDAFVGTEIALLFPFAPSKVQSECSFYVAKPASERFGTAEQIEWQQMMTPDVETVSDISADTDADLSFDAVENPWLSPSPSGYESLHTSEADDVITNGFRSPSDSQAPLEFQSLDGICRLMEQFEPVRR